MATTSALPGLAPPRSPSAEPKHDGALHDDAPALLPHPRGTTMLVRAFQAAPGGVSLGPVTTTLWMHHSAVRLRGGAPATEDDEEAIPIAPAAGSSGPISGQRFRGTDLARLYHSPPPGTWGDLALAGRWVETYVRIVLTGGRIYTAYQASSGDESKHPGSPVKSDSNSSLSASGPRGEAIIWLEEACLRPRPA